MSTPTVVSIKVIPANPKEMVYQTTFMATMSDGTEAVAVCYYDDELSFTPRQFIGRTLAECAEIFHQADVAYLRAP